jgi:hypothetical protein
VKIKGTCKRCGRTFMAEQVIDGGGACPWDGEPFNPDYAAVLVELLREAQHSGERLERALDSIADVAPEFTLDAESVLGKVRADLARLEQNLIRQG